MPEYKYYQDEKDMVWQRHEFTVTAPSESDADAIIRENGLDRECVTEICDERIYHVNSETLFETQSLLMPEENGGKHTLEVLTADKRHSVCTNIDDTKSGTPQKKRTKTVWTSSVCGGKNVACNARINPNTGEILNFFDDMDGECAKCGEVDLDVVEKEIEEDAVSKKELFAFVWPYQLMSRNATNEQIIEAYENGPLRSDDEDNDELYVVQKLTPDELAAEINDNDCAFGQYYVRFIEIPL